MRQNLLSQGRTEMSQKTSDSLNDLRFNDNYDGHNIHDNHSDHNNHDNYGGFDSHNGHDGHNNSGSNGHSKIFAPGQAGNSLVLPEDLLGDLGDVIPYPR